MFRTGLRLKGALASAQKSIPASAAPPTAAAPAASFCLGPGFVDRQSSAIDLFAVQSANGRLGLGVAAHLHEAKAFGSSGVSVHDDLRGCHGAVRLKQLPQACIRASISQVANV